MKKVLGLFWLCILFLTACSNSEKATEFEWKVYNKAVELGDANTAINSLNRILIHEKYNGDALDTLAMLYLNSGSNAAALNIGTRAANVRESDATTRVLAKANKGLAKYDEALVHFSKLLEKNPDNLEVLYEMAFVNINLNKFNDAIPFVQQLIAHPNSGSAVMNEYFQNGSQLLPYKAVAFNMLGYMQMQAGQPEDALKSYETALAIFPNYALAQNNLNVLKKNL